MRPGVAEAFVDFSTIHEGWAGYFYLDVKRLVTVGIGELVDPFVPGLDFGDATPAEVQAAWHVVKSNTSLDPRHGGAQYAQLTTIRMPREGVLKLTLSMLSRFEDTLKTYFPHWDDVPAHAQLAALSHAWAFGPHFPATWPSYTRAFNAGQWDECAKQDVPSTAEWNAQNASFHDRILQEQAHLHACVRFTAASSSSDLDDLSLA